MAPSLSQVLASLDPKKLKFLLTGVLNTAFGYSMYAVLIYFKVEYLIALFLATVAGIIFNYFSFSKLVFKSNRNWPAFGKFIAAYAVIYALNAALLSFLTRTLLFNPYIGQAICIPLSVLASWFLMNFWIYKKD
jgi:putative flippase GtrA